MMAICISGWPFSQKNEEIMKIKINKIIDKLFKKNVSRPKISDSSVFLYGTNLEKFSKLDYSSSVRNAYMQNVIANRAISMISRAAASVDWLLYETHDKSRVIKKHPLLKLLSKPNPVTGGAEFFESVYSYKLISGDCFILKVKDEKGNIAELHTLRPDRVEVVAGKTILPVAYLYGQGNNKKVFRVDEQTGYSEVLHMKNFNPSDDWRGMSQLEPAGYSIEIHNMSALWNCSLLKNGARPSGALIIKSNPTGYPLEDEVLEALRKEITEKFASAASAGKPMLMEGDVEWKEMCLTPKDMDYLEAKNSAARDIALSFGVPPQLLGIKGDSTYNNMQEARLAFWEDTVLPLVDKTIDALNNWLVKEFDQRLFLAYDKTNISALSGKVESLWQRVNGSGFLSDDEKRAMVGIAPAR